MTTRISKPKKASVTVTRDDVEYMRTRGLNLSPMEVKSAAKLRAALREFRTWRPSTEFVLSAMLMGVPEKDAIAALSANLRVRGIEVSSL